jgi:hypothetical protein
VPPTPPKSCMLLQARLLAESTALGPASDELPALLTAAVSASDVDLRLPLESARSECTSLVPTRAPSQGPAGGL